MLFSTSLVALILSPRRLQITNTKVCQSIRAAGQILLRVNKVIALITIVLFTAPMHNMRIDFPNYSPLCEAESQTPGDRVGRSDLPLRYPDDEAVVYH